MPNFCSTLGIRYACALLAGYSVGCLNLQPLREYEGQRFDRSASVGPHHLPHRSQSKWNLFRPRSTRHFAKTERARPPANQLLARSRVKGLISSGAREIKVGFN